MSKNFRGTVREAKPLLYGSICHFFRINNKLKYGIKSNIKEVGPIKGPAVLLSTHPSFTDFLYSAPLVYPTKINFVLGYSFYNIKKITKLVYNLGAFPKLQFQNDVGSMKNMKKVIDNNGVLGLYPVGLVSENGESGDIPLATAKVLKWLHSDVYIAYTVGSYMIHPKWAKNKRKGNIEMHFKKLLTKEQVRDMDLDSIQKLVEENLYFNEYKNNEGKKFKGKGLAEGLENLAYKCPKCGNEYHTSTEGNILKCSCGNEVSIDEYGHLHKVKEDDICFDTPLEWYNYEREYIREELKKGTFILEDDVELHMPLDQFSPYVHVGSGHIVMTKGNINYVGTINNEDVDLNISTNGLMACAFSYGKRFEIQHNNTVYVFYPKNKQSVLKYSMAIRESYKIDVLD